MSSTSSFITQKSQFIRAGAGAGKTTRLIETFLKFTKEFKQANSRYPRVVMTTFTRKATQEVKERLLVSALQQNETEIFEYINQKSFVHISTIHGLLSIFLSQYSDKIKFPQDIKIVEGPKHQRILKKQINELIKKNEDYLELLESYFFSELVKISAEALELRAQNKNLSYVTAKELAAFATKQRLKVIALIDDIFIKETNPQKGWIAYFEYLNQLKSVLLRNNLTEIKALLEMAPSKPQFRKNSPSIDPVVNEIISEDLKYALETLWDSDEIILKHEKLNCLFDKFINELFLISYAHKQRTGELSISDLENLSLKIIEEHPESAEEFSNSWDYFMIDEYQDTSPLQVNILNQLVRDKVCFIVGDPQQSIYLFRGARSEVFELKQAELKAREAQIEFLKTNYRSEPSLMTFINDFFNKFSSQFQPMELKLQKNEKKQIKTDAFYIKSNDQILGALQQIRYFLDQGVAPKDICVLSRNNKNLNELAVSAKKQGIHVQLQAAAGFELKREILDLIAFTRFLNNPHDDENFITLVRSPWFYISDAELVKLSEIKNKKKFSFWATIVFENHSCLKTLDGYLRAFGSMGTLQTIKYFISQTEFLNFSELYDPTGKREANVIKFLMNLAQAEKSSGFSLGLFLEEQFQSVQIETGSANSEAQPVVQPDCVSLMTVHASKGLQFKHVIVLGFADRINLSNVKNLSFEALTQRYSLAPFNDDEVKPIALNWAQEIKRVFNERETKENERVLYVGMTRAIESVSFVAEVAKTPPKNSWFAKVDWPEQGQFEFNGYLVQSITNDDIYESPTSTSKIDVSVRKKFSEQQIEANTAQSVTDLISASGIGQKIEPSNQLLNLKKAQYGSNLHRIFESLKYLDFATIKTLLTDQDLEAVQYLESLKEIDLFKILQQGHNEWGFGLKTKVKMIQGQIDLWAELADAIYVIDYKTGSSFYSEKAFEQLSFYTKALLQMQQISSSKPIIHAVIYVIEKQTKIKTYDNSENFEKLISPKILEIF